jgi:DNA-binding winged helix-turn-helix (wHTH) protein/tetratricopeptide (TPR) repeat protein
MVDRPATSSPLRVHFDEFELDEANARLVRNRTAVALPPTPFGLLCALVRHAGSLLTKNALLDEVWGHRFVSDSVLKGAISDIRTALGDDPRNPRFIETLSRRGYRFIAVPRALEASDSSSSRIARGAQSPNAEVTPTASASQARHATSLIGRGAILERLGRAWDRAAAGTRTFVWVAGEPGIGKTALIERFASELGETQCVRGHCVQQYGSAEPYLPVLEALAELCRSDTDVPSRLRAVAPTWLLQLPWVSSADEREALRREVAGAHPERMLREMAEFLDQQTRERPLLLVTEDLHWSDQPTIKLIDFLARRRSAARLMWVSTFRLAEVIATDHPLKSARHELLMHGLCEEIVLDSFSEADVATYLNDRWPSIAADENLVRAVHERTEGVPLFIASMMGDIAARSAASGVSTAHLVESSPVPENLLAIIDHYSQRLGNERRSLLSAAAVCGAEFRVDILAKVLDKQEFEVAEECERLLREQLWLSPPRAPTHGDGLNETYSFRHALFRQVLYDRMGIAARAALHRRVASVLESERATGRIVSAAQLATHFDLGRSPTDALTYYAEAAEAALTQLSPTECLSVTERALSLLKGAPANPERASIELTLGTLRGLAALHVYGCGDESQKAYMQAHSRLADVPLHPLRGQLVQGLGQLLNARAEYSEALAVAGGVEALIGGGGDPLLTIAASTTRGQAYMMLGRPRQAREAFERALPVIDPGSAASDQKFIADLRATSLSLLSIPLTHLGLVSQARARLQQAYELVDRLGQPVSRMVTMWCDALVQVRLGNIDKVAALATQMRALVEKYSLAQGRTACRWFEAWAKTRSDRSRKSFEQIRAAYEENIALGMIEGGSETLGYAAEALVLQGDLDGAERQVEQALGIVDRFGERIYLPQLLLTQGTIADLRGKSSAAEASFRLALEESRAQEAPWLELLALTVLCEGRSAKKDDRRALATLVSELAEARGQPAYKRAEAALTGARP